MARECGYITIMGLIGSIVFVVLVYFYPTILNSTEKTFGKLVSDTTFCISNGSTLVRISNEQEAYTFGKDSLIDGNGIESKLIIPYNR